ncbi:MAG: sortase [Clostridiales bacterium]|jgi:LPXTG-site transpeptidase (sortase) family protein|nr:sortase [Clostridium sp. CAG:567]
MKKKIYNIILIILALILLVVISIIAFKRINNQIKEKELINTVADIKVKLEEIKESENDEKTITKYKGYDIVGIIEIPKINIEYPIINQTSDETMALSITKFWGNNVNDIGNFTMAGHNYFDGTMFSNTNKLNIEDTIKMTDLDGKTIEYKVFDKYIIDPNDVKCVQSVKENTREITLITCINGRNNRLVVKARENI